MLREEQSEVLITGAGPVGMLSALLLAQGGVRVRIIDRDWRTTSRTYACALHSHTLKLLDRLGLARDVLALGHEVSKVAFYEGETRHAEVRLSQTPTEFPFVLVVPQSAFEQLLEEKLKKSFGVHVEWNHQMSNLRLRNQGVSATVDKLGVSAKGYIVPEMDWSVEKTITIGAEWVVGADGPNSFVAQSLKTSYETAATPEFFAVFELESDWRVDDELRIVLNKNTTSVLWPVGEGRCRWSFQLRQEHLAEFPSKERASLIVDSPGVDQATREFIQRMLKDRAPWFTGNIQNLGWSSDVEFEHRVAQSFGQQHCWMVGDAAHQTGPAGMQSMNRGLAEADQLAGALVRILRAKAPLTLLDAYNQTARAEWRQLLGLSGTLKARHNADQWVQERRARILSCLPASGDDLTQLLDQLQLELLPG